MIKSSIKRSSIILKKFKEVEAVYIYGSSLQRKDFEDVDMALLMTPSSRKKWDSIKLEIACALEKVWKKECDIHILQEMPSHLQYRIICEGKVILSQNKIGKVRFEAKVLSEFLEFKPTYEWFNNRILKRYAYG